MYKLHRPILFQPFCADTPGTDGAATFSGPCSRINYRLPHMTLVTFPPHFAVRACGDQLWCQVAVQCRVPLLGHLRCQSYQIIEPRQHLSSRTVRTAAATHGAGSYCGLVVMTFLATPPYLSVGTGRDLLRSQCFIFARMPLGCNGRKLTG